MDEGIFSFCCGSQHVMTRKPENYFVGSNGEGQLGLSDIEILRYCGLSLWVDSIP
jgi:hypothetical protein